MKRLAVAALAGALLMPLLASARHVDVRDPDDTRGLLDLSLVEMSRSRPPTWRLVTRHGWSVGGLWDRGFILVYLDTFGTRRADYYALVRSKGNDLVGTLYRDGPKNDARVRSLRARHPSRRVAKVEIPLHNVRRRDSNVYRWYALTMFSSDHCERFCFDRAPNEGFVAEPGTGSTPTPTLPPPTPTITP